MPVILLFELSIHNGPGIGHKVKILKILPWLEQVQFSSVTQLCLTLWPHGLQYARLPCPLPSPRACLNSCPLSQWYRVDTFINILWTSAWKNLTSTSAPVYHFMGSKANLLYPACDSSQIQNILQKAWAPLTPPSKMCVLPPYMGSMGIHRCAS